MHNFKRDILHILQIFCVLFLPSFLLSHAKKPSAAGTKKEKVQRLLLRNRWTSWSASCFPSRTFPSPSFLLIFFLPVPSPINPFSPAHRTASPRTAPRTVCRSAGSPPAVAHRQGSWPIPPWRPGGSCSGLPWGHTASGQQWVYKYPSHGLQTVLPLTDQLQALLQDAVGAHVAGNAHRAQQVIDTGG